MLSEDLIAYVDGTPRDALIEAVEWADLNARLSRAESELDAVRRGQGASYLVTATEEELVDRVDNVKAEWLEAVDARYGALVDEGATVTIYGDGSTQVKMR